jgi:hypothetical protein
LLSGPGFSATSLLNKRSCSRAKWMIGFVRMGL